MEGRVSSTTSVRHRSFPHWPWELETPRPQGKLGEKRISFPSASHVVALMCFGKAVPGFSVTSTPAPGITRDTRPRQRDKPRAATAASRGVFRRWPQLNSALTSSQHHWEIPQQNPTILRTLRAPFSPSSAAGEGETGTNPSLNTEKEDSAVRAPISSWKEEWRYFSQLDTFCFFVRE